MTAWIVLNTADKSQNLILFAQSENNTFFIYIRVYISKLLHGIWTSKPAFSYFFIFMERYMYILGVDTDEEDVCAP